jgi:predicted RNA-binding Zn-ribbon protein involved in translation (DUF1610 family)
MKKVQLEHHHQAYYEIVEAAHAHLSQHEYVRAVELASTAWGHIDGMLKYERRYENQSHDSLDAIDIVLRYAPLLFLGEALDRLGQLLQAKRTIDKHVSLDIAGELTASRTRLSLAYRLWNWIDRGGKHDDHGFQQICRDRQHVVVLQEWSEMQLVSVSVDAGAVRAEFVTRLDAYVHGKCPSCGAKARARKRRFLSSIACPNCKADVYFTLI